jgi:hypothetical protein
MFRKTTGFLLMGLLIGALGCAKSKQDTFASLDGVFDGYSYTSESGLFTVMLKDWADLTTLKDNAANQGASLGFTFTDIEGNAYSIIASFATPDIEPEKFIDNLVAKGKADNRPVSKNKTMDGTDCMVSTSLEKQPNSEDGFGILNLVFYRNQTIFDIAVKTKAAKDPNEAAAQLDKLLSRLWQASLFRGIPEGQPEFMGKTDPRIPVIAHAAKRVADDMKLRFALEQPKKLVIRLTGQGAEGKIVIRIGVAVKNREITTTEAVSSLAGDKKLGEELKAKFFEQFGQYLTAEMLSLGRDLTYDEDLADMPIKKP